jgi:hypothetical protein
MCYTVAYRIHSKVIDNTKREKVTFDFSYPSLTFQVDAAESVEARRGGGPAALLPTGGPAEGQRLGVPAEPERGGRNLAQR